MTTFDFAPAADALARAVAGVRDDQLTATTPCTDYSLAALLTFVGQVASDEGVPGLFGPRRPAAPDADPFEQLLALTGRDPRWTP